MKLWEILPQLKINQKIKVIYKDGSESEMEWDGTFLRYAETELRVTIQKSTFEADYEIIPQSVPFEEALKALREGKRVRCDSKGYGSSYYDLNDDNAPGAIVIKEEIVDGVWYIC